MPGKTTEPESIRPGFRTPCSTCASTVSQEVLAPFGVARSLSFLIRMDAAGRARGLSGAPDGARGRRPSSEALHRLDPDGWLVQSMTDTNPIESPAALGDQKVPSHHAVTGQGCGICGKLLRTFQQLPQPRRRIDEINSSFPDQAGPSGPAPGKRCLLDTRLLMGGTSRPARPSAGHTPRAT